LPPSQAFKGKNNIEKRYSIVRLKSEVKKILRGLEGYGIFFVSVEKQSRGMPKIHFVAFNLHGKMVFIRVSYDNSMYKKKRYSLRWTENMLPGKYVVVDKNTVKELKSFLVSELVQHGQG
jgi:predicted molibdopterin-dependent oxidoreductase YjgC